MAPRRNNSPVKQLPGKTKPSVDAEATGQLRRPWIFSPWRKLKNSSKSKTQVTLKQHNFSLTYPFDLKFWQKLHLYFLYTCDTSAPRQHTKNSNNDQNQAQILLYPFSDILLPIYTSTTNAYASLRRLRRPLEVLNDLLHNRTPCHPHPLTRRSTHRVIYTQRTHTAQLKAVQTHLMPYSA